MEFAALTVIVLSFFLNLPYKCNSLLETSGKNIILNPTFDDGINNWSGRGCEIVLKDSMQDGAILPKSGKYFVTTSERTQTWNGIQQEITGRVQQKLAYEVSAAVRVLGNNVSDVDVQVALWVQMPDKREHYIGIAKLVPSTSSSAVH